MPPFLQRSYADKPAHTCMYSAQIRPARFSGANLTYDLVAASIILQCSEQKRTDNLNILTSKTECDIRMDFDTNEYPNIFVLRK